MSNQDRAYAAQVVTERLQNVKNQDYRAQEEAWSVWEAAPRVQAAEASALAQELGIAQCLQREETTQIRLREDMLSARSLSGDLLSARSLPETLQSQVVASQSQPPAGSMELRAHRLRSEIRLTKD